MNNYLDKHSECIERYLKELHNTKPLSSDEEISLAKQIKAGDKKAFNKLIKANLRFVVGVAKNYQNQGLPLEDLISIGNRGLIKAATKFDGLRNIKFISYAVWWIRQSILQELAEQSRVVRVPINIVSKIQQYEKIRQKMMRTQQREISIEEIANETGTKLDDLLTLVGLSSKATALDATVADGEYTLLDNLVAPEEEDPFAGESTNIIANMIFEKIPNGRYREILRKIYGFDGHPPRTLEEISVEMGISRERVRQLKEAAIRHIRQKLPQSLSSY